MKFSVIIPFYGNRQNNFKYCIEALLRQNFKDFEIIICGNKVQDNDIQYLNGIKILNLVIDTNNISMLINNGMKLAEGEYIQFWNPDLVSYEDYLQNINKYILKYGDNYTFVGRHIDTRNLQARKNFDELEFKIPDVSEGLVCFHRKHFEPLREEFNGGFGTHCYVEFNVRLWKKTKFVCMREVEVVHIPHDMRLTPEEALVVSNKSSQVYEMIKHGLL